MKPFSAILGIAKRSMIIPARRRLVKLRPHPFLLTRLFRNLIVGKPSSEVQESRSDPQYRISEKRLSSLNASWIRQHWFLKSPTEQRNLLGYCSLCSAWTPMHVDHSVCSEFEGQRIPWWTNTISCWRCGTTARLRAAFDLAINQLNCRAHHNIYLTEQKTPFFRAFRAKFPNTIGSEFVTNLVNRGSTTACGIRCEDLCQLTFADGTFDFVLSFEVLEHVPNYRKALQECFRVLRAGGKLVISVPFHGEAETVERCRLLPDGSIEHYLPPEYHGDPVRPDDGVLCFRYFGVSFLNDLLAAGFNDAWILSYWSAELGYLGENRAFFVATR